MLFLVTVFADVLCATLLGSWTVLWSVVRLLRQASKPGVSHKTYSFWDAVIGFLLLDFAMHGRFGPGILFVLVAAVLAGQLKGMLLNGKRALQVLMLLLFLGYYTLMQVVTLGFWAHPVDLIVLFIVNLVINLLLDRCRWTIFQ